MATVQDRTHAVNGLNDPGLNDPGLNDPALGPV